MDNHLINKAYYPIDDNIIANLTSKYNRLEKSFKVKNNNEKKLALEDFGKYLFELCPLFKVEANIPTLTNEIDLYLTIQPHFYPHPFLNMLGYTMICECKNINKKIDSRKTDNVDTLMRDKNSKIGVYISRQGFTGKNPISDGKGRVYKAFAEERKYIICITYKEIYNRIIENRESLLKIIQEKCDQIHKNY